MYYLSPRVSFILVFCVLPRYLLYRLRKEDWDYL